MLTANFNNYCQGFQLSKYQANSYRCDIPTIISSDLLLDLNEAICRGQYQITMKQFASILTWQLPRVIEVLLATKWEINKVQTTLIKLQQ